jgi:hypothetical protein
MRYPAFERSLENLNVDRHLEAESKTARARTSRRLTRQEKYSEDILNIQISPEKLKQGAPADS